jgi:hypothetical protein
MIIRRIEIPKEFNEFLEKLPNKSCDCATLLHSCNTVYTILERIYRVAVEPLQDGKELFNDIVPDEVNVVATFSSSERAAELADNLNQEQNWNNATAIDRIESLFGTRNVTFSIDETTYSLVLTIRLHTVHGNSFNIEASELN